MRLRLSLLALSAVAILSACDGSDNDRTRHYRSRHGYTVSAAAGSIYVHKNDLVIRSDEHDTAVIHPDASLSVDGDDVPVTEAGRKALNGYRAAYKSLAEDAINLGLDGVDLGVSVMGKVMKGLLDGTADEAGKEADRRGKALDQRARGLCTKLSALRDAQQNVVAAVPQFSDYAVIDVDEVKDCFDDNQKDAVDDKTVDKAESASPPEPPNPAPPVPPKPGASGKSYNFNIETGNWSIRHGSVLIPSTDGDEDKEASVAEDGSLHIGEKSIDIPDAGRAALVRFHHSARNVENEGVGLGLAGVDIALGAVGSALHGVFGGDTKKSEQDLEHRGDAMNVRVKRLCGYLSEMRSAQQDAVAAIPQFKPYAVVNEKDVRDCGVDKKKAKESSDPSPAS
jgi:hypothetical protein